MWDRLGYFFGRSYISEQTTKTSERHEKIYRTLSIRYIIAKLSCIQSVAYFKTSWDLCPHPHQGTHKISVELVGRH